MNKIHYKFFFFAVNLTLQLVYLNKLHAFENVKLLRRQNLELPWTTPLNHPTMQNCNLIRSESFSLRPLPKIANMTKQGDFGACYHAADLNILEWQLHSAHPNEAYPKFSFSDTMCFSSNQFVEGGSPIGSLLSLAFRRKSILPAKKEKVHQSIAISRYRSQCNAKNAYGIENDDFAMMTALEVGNYIQEQHRHKEKDRITLDHFSIKDRCFKKNLRNWRCLQSIIQQNQMINFESDSHIASILQTNSYLCGETKLKTIVALDPNGHFIEIAEKDFFQMNPGMFTVHILSKEIPFKDIYDPQKAIYHLAAAGDFQAMQEILKSEKINLTQISKSDRPWLYFPAMTGRLDIVQFLLDQGLDPNSSQNIYREEKVQKMTPLFAAAIRGQSQVVNLLLQHGANPDIPKIDFNNQIIPLLYAVVEVERIDIARLLLEKKIDPDAPSIDENGKKTTPLYKAVTLKNLEMVRLLLEKNANPRIANERTPLCEAIIQGSKEIVALLLNYDCDLNHCSLEKPEITPLLMAVKWEGGNKEIVELLLKAGADKNKTISATMNGKHFTSLLELAKEIGNQEIVKLLQ